LHPERPSGSQRNVWQTTVDLIEPLGDTVRVTLATPMPVAVDVTPGAIASLRLTEGATVWAAVKATEINAVEA
ncbi:MAG: TOBE domain-containing protein, partial [Ilumatobacter sp.]